MESLLTFLQSIHPMSPGLIEYLSRVLKVKKYSKREFLLKPGQVCTNAYFISTGLVRCFYQKGDVEVSSWFMKEGDVVISAKSFYQQVPSNEAFQALEDCELFYITYTEFQYINQNFIEFNFIGRVLTEKYYQLVWKYINNTRMKRAHEKYEFMLKQFPDLIQRVPSKFIASYLSITEPSLSRVRAMRKPS